MHLAGRKGKKEKEISQEETKNHCLRESKFTDDGLSVLAARGHVELFACSQSKIERVLILSQMIVDLKTFKEKKNESSPH